MIKIYAPFVDQPKRFSLPLDRTIQLCFAIGRRIRMAVPIGNWANRNIYTLGGLDPWLLKDIDPLTLGDISGIDVSTTENVSTRQI